MAHLYNIMVKETTNQTEQEQAVGQQNRAQFLQSREWGEFQKSLGRQVWFFGSSLVIKHILGLGRSYLYSPRGPVETRHGASVQSHGASVQSHGASVQSHGASVQSEDLLNEIKELAKQEKSIFWRMDPIVNIQNLKLKQVKDVQPSSTLILDLTKSEEELLNDLHPKTRYNIKLAQRKGVEIKEVEFNEENFETFWKLLETTYTRSQIKTHPKSYYQKMLEVLSPKGMAKLLFAEYEGQVLTANLVIYYKDTVTYLHGGSSNEHRNLMAPHLLQWYTIKEAKSKGFKYYDFWGISSSSPSTPPQQARGRSGSSSQDWAGITRFKKGFGGQEVNYPGTFDLVFSRVWYSIYRVVRLFQ